MTMKSFTTAANEAARGDDESYPFVLDKHPLTAFYPGDGQIAVLMAETSRHADLRTKVAGAIDFFNSVFDDEDASYLRNRLLDRHDDFGIAQVQEIIEWLLEEWSGHPTDSPSASTRSRQSGGPKSRPATRKSTSSR